MVFSVWIAPVLTHYRGGFMKKLLLSVALCSFASSAQADVLNNIFCYVSRFCAPSAVEVRITISGRDLYADCPMRDQSDERLIQKTQIPPVPNFGVIVSTSGKKETLFCEALYK